MKKYGRANQSVSITVIKGIRIINKSNWTYSAMISSSSSSHGHGLRSQLTMLSTTRNPYSGGSLGEKMCRVFPRFQPKNSQKKTTCFFVGPPPLPHRGLTRFYKEPPSPLKGPRGLCTVPYCLESFHTPYMHWVIVRHGGCKGRPLRALLGGRRRGGLPKRSSVTEGGEGFKENPPPFHKLF